MKETIESISSPAPSKQSPGSRRFDRRYFYPIGYVAAVTAGGPLALKGFTGLSGLESSFDVHLSRGVLDGLGKLYGFALLAGILLLAALGLANIVLSFRAGGRGETDFCVNAMLIMKYGLLVFFVGNFITVLAVLVVGGLVALIASRGMAIFALPGLLLFLPVFAFCTWLILIPGAFYGVQVILLGVREKKIGFPAALVHFLLQFTFLFDNLDAMYLSIRKWNMGKKSALVVGAVYLLGVAGMVWLVLQFV